MAELDPSNLEKDEVLSGGLRKMSSFRLLDFLRAFSNDALRDMEESDVLSFRCRRAADAFLRAWARKFPSSLSCSELE